MTACNYDISANADCSGVLTSATSTPDLGCCVYGFSNVTVGDPNTTDQQGNLVNTPVYYQDGTGSAQTVTHWVGQAPTSTPYNSSTQAQNSIYPFDSCGASSGVCENDIALSFRSLSPNMSQYLPGDTITATLRKLQPNGIAWLAVDTKTWTNPNWNNQTLGDRISTYPYPWGLDPSGSNNYVFDIFEDPSNPNSPKQQYKIDIEQTIDGTNYGPTSTCGVSHQFEFITLSPCDHPGAIHGCTTVGACNHNPAATCDDGSCVTPPTTACWSCQPTSPTTFDCIEDACGACDYPCSTGPGPGGAACCYDDPGPLWNPNPCYGLST